MKRRAKKEPSMIADAVYQPRLLELFADIEREFRALYEENQECLISLLIFIFV
jgi:hypothetical protein